MPKGMTTTKTLGDRIGINPLQNLRLSELRKLAKKKRIKSGDMTKDQLIAAMENK